jgi:integrase
MSVRYESRLNSAGNTLVRALVGYRGKIPVRVCRTFPKGTHYKVIEKWVAEVKAIGVPPPKPPNFDKLIDRWLAFKRPQIAGRTYRDYHRECHLYLKGKFGILPNITSRDLQALFDSYSHLSPRTIQKIRTYCVMILDYGVLKGYLDKSPVTKDIVIPRKKRQRVIRVLSIEQFDRLRDALEDELGLLTLLQTGLRIGELLALEPKHILPGAVRVEQSLDSLWGERIVGPPKSDHSYRTISVPETLSSRLLEQHSGPFVCELNYEHLKSRLRRYCRDLGLARMTLHGLRHSHCTYLLAKGVNIIAVSRRMGHHSPAFTLSVYGHLVPSMDEGVLAALG